MIRISMTAALAAILFLLPAIAFASCTASVSAPALSVAMKDPPVNYRFDLDSAALAKIANENGMPGLKGEIPFGLTMAATISRSRSTPIACATAAVIARKSAPPMSRSG
jgi:hypothetical protein